MLHVIEEVAHIRIEWKERIYVYDLKNWDKRLCCSLHVFILFATFLRHWEVSRGEVQSCLVA